MRHFSSSERRKSFRSGSTPPQTFAPSEMDDDSPPSSPPPGLLASLMDHPSLPGLPASVMDNPSLPGLPASVMDDPSLPGLPASVVDDPLLPGLPDDLALRCLAFVSDSSLWGVCKRWQGMLATPNDLCSVRAGLGVRDPQWLYTLVLDKHGSYGWHALDPVALKWHALAPMPGDVDFQLSSPGSIGSSHAVQCVNTKKKLIMIAGMKQTAASEVGQQWSQLEPALEEPWVFDSTRGQWKKGLPFRWPRRWCACGVVDEKVYVASGCGQQWNMILSKSTDMYDPESDSWESLPSLESTKFSGEAISALSVKGNLLMITGKGVATKEGAMFSPHTRKWSKMPVGLRRGWMRSCVAMDDMIFAHDSIFGRISVYNSDDDNWEPVMNDPKLKDLINLTATEGKICGLVDPGDGKGDIKGSHLRIIDVLAKPPRIFEVDVPQGRVVSMHILSRMAPSPLAM